jgi:hypothetical protein
MRKLIMNLANWHHQLKIQINKIQFYIYEKHTYKR